MKGLTALSFFSGALGLDLGLESAGFEILSVSEVDPRTVDTIKANRPDVPQLGNILDCTVESIRRAAGLKPRQSPTLVVGGPPCQAFSSAGRRRGLEDPRGNVFLTFLDLATGLQPEYIVIENVRGLLSAPLSHRPHSERSDSRPLTEEERPGGVLNLVIRRLNDHGYGCSFNLYNAANFGSPQVRERVVLVAHQGGETLPFLTPTNAEDGSFGLPKWRTFRDAVIGLEESEARHISFPEKRLKYYRRLTAGQNWRSLPEDLQREAMGQSYYAGGGKTGFYRRLAWDKPAPTLVTHPAMPATDLCHPELLRPLSIQEYMRVQEFPDDWKFCGTLIDQYRQIGNAVPVSLGRAIGRLIVDHASGFTVSQKYANFRFSRYRNTCSTTWPHASDEVKQLLTTRKQHALVFAE